MSKNLFPVCTWLQPVYSIKAPHAAAFGFYLNTCRIGQLCSICRADSAKLAICHNRRVHSNKVFRGKAARGKISTGWFYGLKLFLVINAYGKL